MPKPPCEKCTEWMKTPSKLCDGTTEELREFESWEDLTAHMSEGTITAIVNYHAQIIEEYLTLKSQHDDARARRVAYQDYRKALIDFARRELSQDEIDALKARAEEKAITKVETHMNGKVKVHYGR